MRPKDNNTADMLRRMGICLRNLLLCYEVLILNMRKLWETRESFKKSFPRVWGCFLDGKPRGEISGAFIWCTNMKKRGATNRALC